LIAFIIANTVSLMQLRVAGRFASTTIAGGAFEMWLQGQRVTSVLVAFCAVLAPAAYLLLMLTILLAARRSPMPQWTGELLRWLSHLQVWSMLEVVMLGILVALTKIAQLATVDPGVGMYAFGAVVFLIPAIMASFNAREIWLRVKWTDRG
jgi:paraquat-inducible protein A